MNKLWIPVLTQIAKALVGSLNYQRIKDLVAQLQMSQMTGAEKRLIVIDECKSIALAVGASLLNLAIEIAVTSLKERSK